MNQNGVIIRVVLFLGGAPMNPADHRLHMSFVVGTNISQYSVTATFCTLL